MGHSVTRPGEIALLYGPHASTCASTTSVSGCQKVISIMENGARGLVIASSRTFPPVGPSPCWQSRRVNALPCAEPSPLVPRYRRPGLLRPERRHELDEVRLPQPGVVMAEMAVRVGARRDQHIAAVLDALHRPLDSAELRRVGVVLGVVDQQHLGRDLVEVGLEIISSTH